MEEKHGQALVLCRLYLLENDWDGLVDMKIHDLPARNTCCAIRCCLNMVSNGRQGTFAFIDKKDILVSRCGNFIAS